MQYIFYIKIGSSDAAVRCGSYEEDSLLDGFIKLNNVTGLNDTAHKDMNITSIIIKKTSITYYVIGEEIVNDDFLDELSEESEEESELPIAKEDNFGKKRRSKRF